MTSLRSHFRQHLLPGDSTTSKNKSMSRIPTKNQHVEAEKALKAVQPPSKLVKKPSKMAVALERKFEKGAMASATSLNTPSNVPVANRRLSGAQSSVSLTSHWLSKTSSVLPAPPVIRTPSLISGSSISTFDSPQSVGLRRKPSEVIDRFVAQRRNGSESSDMDRSGMHDRSVFDNSVLGISLPHVSAAESKNTSVDLNTMPFVPYDRYNTPAEESIPRGITPHTYAMSATPSTRYTESPFSHVPTPSSMSSYSPALTTASGISNRPRPSSPTRSNFSSSRKAPLRDIPSLRQPTSRMRDGKSSLPTANTHGGSLAPVRESSTSSSNSASKRGTIIEPVAQESIAISPNKARSKRLSKIAPPPARVPSQVPPELAHLNVEPSAPPAPTRQTPPARPSRDGTPDLAGMQTRTNVVQSDLPLLYTTYHKRTPSTETPTTAPSPSVKSRFGFSPKTSSLRDESPRIDSAISPPPAAVSFSRGSTPDISSDNTALRRRDSPALVPPSPTKRFGFFSRKTKPEVVSKTAEKPKRAAVKGPVAGTGHEGYARFGVRGRSGSSNSVTSVRSPSADSTSSYVPRPKPSRQGSHVSKASTDASDMDDFLKERLNPVILRGSGSAITRTVSAPDVPSTASQATPAIAASSDNLARPQLLPSALQKSSGLSPSKASSSAPRRPSDSSEDGLAIRFPSRLNRSSVARSSVISSASSSRIPPPIDTIVSHAKQSLDSYDAEMSTLSKSNSERPVTDDALHGREGVWLRSGPADAAPRRKMNFLQRALAKGKEPGSEPMVVPLRRGSSVRSSMSSGPYPLLDSVQPIDLREVGRMVAETGSSTEDSTAEAQLPAMMVPYESRHVSLLPAPAPAPAQDIKSAQPPQSRLKKPTPPRIRLERQDSGSPELLRAKPVFAKQSANLVDIPRSPSDARRRGGLTASAQNAVTAQAEPASTLSQPLLSTPELRGDQSPKQPRLSPIGRIPKVVSKRDRDRKLPDNSFSRPFARHQPRPSNVKPPGSVYTQIREMASPIENGSSSSQPVSSTSGQSEELSHELGNSSVFTGATTESTARTSMDIYIPDEFLAMPRKNSDVSYSTSSGHPSWQFLQPQQEDIWNEYNDFIDEVMPTHAYHKKTISTASSLGAPFQYANVLSDVHQVPEPFPYHVGPAPTISLPMLPGAIPVQSALSVPQQVTNLLHPSLAPMTPEMVMSLIGGYDRRSQAATSPASHRQSLPVTPRSNLPQPKRSSLAGVRESISSSRYSRSSTHSRTTSLPGSNGRNSQVISPVDGAKHHRDSALHGIAEHSPKDVSTQMADLRRSALLTAKWLSFGQVLFSPAHNEVQFTEEPRVLVVDGLNADWSYFVALSYPIAAVYNLHLPHHPTQSWPDIHTPPPANHRSIPQADIAASFPFPKGFFTAVVLRFPPVASEPAYAACLAECKRVLRPGGFLEVAALELDLAHAAARARQAVRGLKTRLQQLDPSLSLRNAGDVFVRLIGRRGFESVQRCVVGVPVSGRGPRSLDGSSVGSDVASVVSGGKERAGFSFGDLVQESMREPGQRMDDAIGRAVSKVGRWWYSACYERAALPGDRSIWTEAALLKESEREGTTFRLLICHAQKPAQVKRRTVSV